jgi:hypothetical protein
MHVQTSERNLRILYDFFAEKNNKSHSRGDKNGVALGTEGVPRHGVSQGLAAAAFRKKNQKAATCEGSHPVPSTWAEVE